MSPLITIELDVPAGSTVKIVQANGVVASYQAPEMTKDEAFQRYWYEHLSDNTRKLFIAAATVERDTGDKPFTLEQLATQLNMDWRTVRSYKQTLGRIEQLWLRETGQDLPSYFIQIPPTDPNERRQWRLPLGVAGSVLAQVNPLTARR